MLRKENGAGRAWRFLTSGYTTKLLTSRCMILAQKQKYRPMKQDRKPRDKHLISLTKEAKNTVEKIVFSMSGAGKTGQLCVKE